MGISTKGDLYTYIEEILSPILNLGNFFEEIWLSSTCVQVPRTLFLCHWTAQSLTVEVFLWADDSRRAFSSKGESGANSSSLLACRIYSGLRLKLKLVHLLSILMRPCHVSIWILSRILHLWFTMAPYYFHLSSGPERFEDVSSSNPRWCLHGRGQQQQLWRGHYFGHFGWATYASSSCDLRGYTTLSYLSIHRAAASFSSSRLLVSILRVWWLWLWLPTHWHHPVFFFCPATESKRLNWKERRFFSIFIYI